MDSDVLAKIIQLFEIRIGLNPDNMTRYAWEKLIQKRMQILKISTLPQYYHYFWASETEFKDLLEQVIVPETWFFRDKAAFDFIYYYAIHKWLKKENRSQLLNILCIPCSTGEEAISIAITLSRAGIPKSLYRIDAWDISEENLTKAKRGIYPQRSFRDKEIFLHNEMYFDKIDHQYKIKESFIENIFFRKANALKIEQKIHYQIIVCRNLLIYLSPRSQQKVLENIKELMEHDSILIVSPVETQLVKNFGFLPVSIKEPFAFSKYAQQTPAPTPMMSPKHHVFEPLKSEDLLQKAIYFADHENFDEAKKICYDLLKKESTHAEALFLLGVLHHATENLSEAENFFKKTIYLNPDHYDALLYLALLAEKKENFKEAQLYRNRAMRTFSIKNH